LGLCAERHFWIGMSGQVAIAAMANGAAEYAGGAEAAKF
jgi:hypothetical protein